MPEQPPPPIQNGFSPCATYLIFEAINEAEFEALPEGHQKQIQTILGLTFVDTRANTQVRTKLDFIFRGSSITSANLLSLYRGVIV